ncbi:MAG TPA: hypothetical protein VKA53_03765 [Thermoanaerobaculia bacterium]|nr:hypothetical protein [Thermoanaerobaculia bacterium]
MILRRIGVLSMAKIWGAMYCALGLIFGAIIAIFAVMGSTFAQQAASGSTPKFVTALFGVGAVVFVPLLYGFFGFLMGLVGAAIYNGLAALIGGIELDLR